MPADSVVEDPTRKRLLDAAEQGFYGRGIQAVSMDELRGATGLPLRRIYQMFASKEEMVVAFLRRRHDRMMATVTARVGGMEVPSDRVLAVFDYLEDWLRQPDFRGCPWMNAYGELGPTNAAVAEEVRHHQRAFRRTVSGIATDAGYSDVVAEAVYLLVEGAVATAAVRRTAAPAREARAAAEMLLESDRLRRT